MDFSRPHIYHESVASRSNIRYIALPDNDKKKKDDQSLDDRVIASANQAAQDLLLGPGLADVDPRLIDATRFQESMTPSSDTIQPGSLVVIFESFDNLNFVYAKSKEIFNNRNGHFHHDDFIGKPFGCKIRSRNNRGYGYCFLLKPTPELWSRSVNHRTQIVHELDASMICFYLQLRPNMVVCETGTGSGAMSHAIMRTISPAGKLHTFEFNHQRATQARQEFAENGLSHLVEVYHKDVCGKAPVIENYKPGEKEDTKDNKKEEDTPPPQQSSSSSSSPQQVQGGFGLLGQSVDAIFLDLPEPWLAVPHAAFCLKPDGRLASYSPCVEQTQRTVTAMRKAGFHSLKTFEFRLRENYVHEYDMDPPPRAKRPKVDPNPHDRSRMNNNNDKATTDDITVAMVGDEDTGAEADNEESQVSEAEISLTAGPDEVEDAIEAAKATPISTAATAKKEKTSPTTAVNASSKQRKMVVARPFTNMRGHTAFLTFATAGLLPQPDPNNNKNPTK